MIDWLVAIFTETDFLPHRVCIGGSIWLLSLSVISNLLIFLAYFSIPLTLAYFLRKREQQDFKYTLWLFVAFIFACGTTHLLHAMTYWLPWYWLQATLDGLTAIISVYTALYLWPLLPKLLNLPSPEQLLELNRQLQLEITEREAIEVHLRQEVAFSRTLINSLPGVFYQIDMHGRLLDWNDTFATLLGEEGLKMAQLNVLNIVADHDKTLLANKIAEGFAKGSAEVQAELKMAGGECRSFHFIGKTLSLDNQIHLLGTGIDITERKQNDLRLIESEAQFRNTFEYAPVGVVNVTLEGHFLAVNQTYCDFTGYSREELLTMTVMDLTLPEYQEINARLMQQLLAGEIKSFRLEKQYRRKDHSLIWGSLSVQLSYHTDGTPDYFIATIEDITQRKQVEKQLQESEARLNALFENMGSGVAIYQAVNEGEDFCFTGFNHAAELIENLKREDLLGKKLSEVFPNVDQVGFLQALQRVWKTGAAEHYPIIFYQDERISGWRENYIYKLPSGEIVAIYDDVTELKEMELSLRASEEKFKRLLKMLPIPLAIYNADQQIYYTNDRFQQVLGYIPEDVPTLQEWWLHAYPDEPYRQWVISTWDTEVQLAAAENRDVKPLEYEVTCKDGQVRVMQISGITIDDNFLATFVDITTRKQAETALKQQELLLREVLKSLPVGVWVTDANGVFVMVNEAGQKIWAGVRYVGIQDYIEYKGWWHDSGEQIQSHEWAAARAVEKGETSLDEVIDIQCFDGSRKIILNSAVPLQNENAEIVGAIVVNQDITARKAAELALQRSETKFRSVIETSPMPYMVNDEQQNITFINSAFSKTFGYQLSDIPTLTDWWLCAYPDEDYRNQIQSIWQSYLQRAESEDTSFESVEINVHCKDGSVRTVMTSMTMFGGTVARIMVMYDITERKQMEEKLRESEAHLRTIIQNEPECIKIVDAKGRLKQMNPAGLEMIEADSLEQVKGGLVFNLIAPEYRKDYVNLHKRVIAGEVMQMEYEIIGLKGRRRWLETHAVPMQEHDQIVHLAVTRDITERKQAEQQLRELNRDFITFLENTSDFIYFKDQHSRMRFCSQTLANITHHNSWRDLIGKHDFEIFPEETAQIYYQEELPVFAEGQPLINKVNPYYNEDGSKGWVSTSKWPVFDFDNQTVIGVFGISRDITQLKKTEQSLQENEFMLKEAQEIAHLGHWILDVPSQKLYWSDEIYRIFGVEPQEFDATYQAFLEYVHPEDRSFVAYSYSSHLESKSDYAIEHRVLLKNGAIKYVYEKCKTEFDLDNKPLRSLGIVLDITERKQLEKQLHNISLYTRNLIEVSLDPLVTISADGKITDVNKATEKITGFARERLINSDFAGYFTDPEQACAGYLEAFSKGYVTDYSLVIKHCDGYLTDVLFNAAVYKNESGEIAGVFAAARDISALKHIEAELKRSNTDLEQFAYSVSHDMRQPLRSVAGHLQLLSRSLKDKLDEDERENLNFALDGAKRMDAMILSLLDYSRVGRKTESKTWISSREVLNEAMEFLTPAIADAQVEIKITGEWGQVFASYDELTRLFMNLISNAIKYREAHHLPRIEVDSVVTAELWKVSVRDYGIGINPQQIERLFQFFSRLQSRTRFDGTGMGLALCRRIVEHHGGRIWVESEGEGLGCCFRFELPIPEQTAVTSPAENGV